MEQIVVGVFDNRNEAQRAKEELLEDGFAESAVNIQSSDSVGSAAVGSRDKQEGGIAHFFRSLFGMDEHRESADLYAEAVRRGHCVVTVTAADSNEVDEAEDI